MDAHDLIDRDMQIIVELHVVRRAKPVVRSGIDDLPVELLTTIKTVTRMNVTAVI